MITKTKKVYYCSYCKKHGLSSYHMKRHEERCTRNLDRVCGFCGGRVEYREKIAGYKNRIDKELLQPGEPGMVTEDPAYQKVIDDILIEIIDDFETCPACVLTVVRELLRQLPPWVTFNYDYKAEVAKWWEGTKE